MFFDYEKRAKEREAEEARLGLASYDEKLRHRERRFMLGERYHERQSGSWRDAQSFLKKSKQKWSDWWNVR